VTRLRSQVQHITVAGVTVGVALMLGVSPAPAASGWTIVAAPPTGHNANLAAVSSTSASDAWAVGSQDGRPGTGVGATPLIDHWNGTVWSQVATPPTPLPTASLAAVSASSPMDAWAIGRTQINRSNFTPLALHWNGTAWSVSQSIATALGGQIGDGVADISPTDAYAIGGGLGSAHTGLVAHWKDSSWTRVTVPQPDNNNLASNLNAISADGPNDVWIVGTYYLLVNPNEMQIETYTLHWDGSAWKIVLMPLVNPSNVNNEFHFNAIKANGPSDVWAVGGKFVAGQVGTGATLIEHWNGTAWSIVPSPSPGSDANLGGVTTSNAANSVWAVGADTVPGTTRLQTLTLNWNGTAWVTVASPNAAVGSSGLASVSTTPGAAIVQAVGFSGVYGALNPLAMRFG
jgi:hypothetical protein